MCALGGWRCRTGEEKRKCDVITRQGLMCVLCRQGGDGFSMGGMKDLEALGTGHMGLKFVLYKLYILKKACIRWNKTT